MCTVNTTTLYTCICTDLYNNHFKSKNKMVSLILEINTNSKNTSSKRQMLNRRLYMVTFSDFQSKHFFYNSSFDPMNCPFKRRYN